MAMALKAQVVAVKSSFDQTGTKAVLLEFATENGPLILQVAASQASKLATHLARLRLDPDVQA